MTGDKEGKDVKSKIEQKCFYSLGSCVYSGRSNTGVCSIASRFSRPSTVSFVLAECDGFDVIQQRDGWVTFTDYYDNQGDLTKSRIHAITHDRVYNSESGFEVKNTFAFNQDVNPDGTEYFIRGVAHNITVPRYGIVFFDAGLGIFIVVDGDFVEVKFSGNYQADENLLCEAMNQ